MSQCICSAIAEILRAWKNQLGLGQLQRQTRAPKKGILEFMPPDLFYFNRFPRMVPDLSRQLEKEIRMI